MVASVRAVNFRVNFLNIMRALHENWPILLK
jgi:hypothetical protein